MRSSEIGVRKFTYEMDPLPADITMCEENGHLSSESVPMFNYTEPISPNLGESWGSDVDTGTFQ